MALECSHTENASRELKSTEVPGNRGHTAIESTSAFIRDDLKSDLLALQEIAITARQRGRSKCGPLDKIVTELETDGSDWSYFLPPVDETPSQDNAGNEFLAFLWNRKRVRLLTVFEMPLENLELAGKSLFDRMPLVGYFETIREDGSAGNDFVLYLPERTGDCVGPAPCLEVDRAGFVVEQNLSQDMFDNKGLYSVQTPSR